MTTFIELSMYIEQHQSRGGNKSDAARGTFSIPFKNWKPGYVLIASRSSSDEEWTIKNIESTDGIPHREDCVIDLVNKAGELRQVKGSTAQSGYEFKSTGDVPMPKAEERQDIKPITINATAIREFYPRNHGEGTRVIMHDKTAYIVLESYTAVREMLLGNGLALASNGTGAMTGAELQGN